ncbi:MAG: hypothetical protein PWQ96_842 [Clostridia bacterium]|nr:hypothetical protein [Clostridiales bacterium]MDK2985200.1 hypothetical protein [Clostridia bacterium]
MKEFLSKKGIEYQEFDVAKDEKARNEMFEKSGQMAVPQVLVGNEIVVGFDKNKLERLLH